MTIFERFSFLTVSTDEIVGALRGVPERDLAIFARQLSVLVGAEIPMVRTLRIAAAQTENLYLRKIAAVIASEVEGGRAFSEALEAYPRVFSGFIVNMVRSGETSGRLAEVLDYIADEQEKNYDLKTKVRGAFAYPAFIVCGMTVVGFIMMVFVIPKLTEVLRESGARLPLTTRMLIAVSGFMAAWWWLILIVTAVAVVALTLAVSRPRGRRVFDGLKLRVPIFGGLLRRIAIVRFARSMETLLAGGVDVPDALAVAAEVAGNARYRDLILETRRQVQDGHSIATVFAASALVPPMLPQLLAVGEETGRLAEVLRRLGQFYGREVGNLITNLTSLIEPVIMVILGVGVGAMVSAVILPMYNLASQF